MSHDDSTSRLLRIEAALSRIETAVARIETSHHDLRTELLGDSQPGRIQRIERKSARDSKRLSLVERGLCAVFAVVAFLQFALPMARAAGWIR